LAKSHFKIFIILLQINNWDQYSANQNLVKITSIEGRTTISYQEIDTLRTLLLPI